MVKVIALLVFLVSLNAQSLGTSVRGIPFEKASFYVPTKDFTCLDGSDSLPFSYVNDDYCDCNDGSDEPGTSACANAVFFCPNKGHQSKYLLSSRVNDNICDCCDGSDEWASTDVKCTNTCEEEGKKATEELRQKQEVHAQGYQKMLEYSEKGKQKKEEYEAELRRLESDIGVVQSEIEELRQAKENAEEPETKAKDEHRKQWEDTVAAKKAAKREADAREAFAKLDDNSDGYLTTQEVMAHPELDDDGDSTVTLEEAEQYLDGSESVDFNSFLTRVWDAISDKMTKKDEKVDEENEEKKPVVVDDQNNNNDEEEEDEEEDERDKVKSDDTDEMPPYDQATLELIQIADKARKELEDAESRKRDLDSRQSELQRYLGMSLGDLEQFSPLYEQCYEYTDREYTYKLCMFQKVTQRSKNGGRDTSLGDWEGWDGSSGDVYSAMKYTNGEKCWNGPNRSTRVTLKCGTEEKIVNAGEPNRCEYAMEFLTPALCHDEFPNSLHPHVEL